MAVLLGVALASCADSSDPSATSSSSDAASALSGLSPTQRRAFVATDVTGFDWPDDTSLTLTYFGPDQVAMHGNCNDIGGQLAWDGNTMRVDAFPITAAGCPAEAQALDDWLIDLLDSGPVVAWNSATLSMTATVRGQNVSLTFDDES